MLLKFAKKPSAIHQAAGLECLWQLLHSLLQMAMVEPFVLIGKWGVMSYSERVVGATL